MQQPQKLVPSTHSIRSFLLAAKEKFQKRTDPLPIVVLGNEGGDMDSVVSAVVLSHGLTASNNFCVPVLNFPRNDLVLRKDVFNHLQRFGVSPNDLIFVDDDRVDLSQHRVVLVDHNQLCPRQEQAAGKNVVGILDHHVDEKAYLLQTSLVRVIEPVGSAASLVVLHHRDVLGVPLLSAEFILAPILLDTANFTDVKKMTQRDVDAVDFLKQWLPAEFSTEKFYTELHTERTSVDKLSAPEQLRRDYKKFDLCGGYVVGVSSIVVLRDDIKALYKREEWNAAVYQRMGMEKCDLYLNMLHDGGKRQLEVFIAPDGDLVKQGKTMKMFDGFVDFSRDSVGLVLKKEKKGVRLYRQQDTSVSRKNLTPLIAQFWEGNIKSTL